MKRILSILFILAISITLFAQSSMSDPYILYKKELALAMEYYWQKNDSESAIQHLENAYKLLDTYDSPADSIIYERLFCLYMLTDMYYAHSQYIQAENCIVSQIEIYANIGDTINYSYANLIYRNATMLEDCGQNKSALLYYNRARNIYAQLDGAEHQEKLLQNINYHIGEITLKEGYLDLALEYFNYVLRNLNENTENQYKTAETLKRIGDIYYQKKEYIKAESYYQQALDTGALPREPILSQLGHIYCFIGNLEKAEECLKFINPYPDDGYNTSSLFFQLGKAYDDIEDVEKAYTYYSLYIEHIRMFIFEMMAFKIEKKQV